MERTDEHLIQDFSAGNAASFDELFERWRAPLYGFIRGILRDPGLADDAFQEVFIKIIRNAGNFREGARFSSWAFKIADNTCTDFLRREKRIAEKVQQAAQEQKTTQGPETHAVREEEKAILHSHIAALPKEQRTVVILKEFAGLTFKEIAEIMECPLSTAINRMRDALTKLKPLVRADLGN